MCYNAAWFTVPEGTVPSGTVPSLPHRSRQRSGTEHCGHSVSVVGLHVARACRAAAQHRADAWRIIRSSRRAFCCMLHVARCMLHDRFTLVPPGAACARAACCLRPMSSAAPGQHGPCAACRVVAGPALACPCAAGCVSECTRVLLVPVPVPLTVQRTDASVGPLARPLTVRCGNQARTRTASRTGARTLSQSR